MSKFQTKQFLALKDSWYSKLEKEGFEDLEQKDGNLKSWSGASGSGPIDSGFSHSSEQREIKSNAKEDYYRFAGHFLYENQFKDETEEKIWKLHSDGIGMRTIAKTLDSPNYRLYPMKVQKIIKRLSIKMMLDYSVKNIDAD